MMKVVVMVVGSLKEAYWREAEKEYLKRLSPYLQIEIQEYPDYAVKEKSSPKEIEQIKEKENEKILAKLKPNDFVVLLDLGKKEYDSLAFSEELYKWFRQGDSHLVFIIGGSYGLSDKLRARGNAFWTLSKLTFTHQMSRIILLEQLYRAVKIAHHEPYHK